MVNVVMLMDGVDKLHLFE